MKSTGVVRMTDKLGRIVLPKELRITYGIDDKTPIEIFVGDNGAIILRKHITHCVLCGDEYAKSELKEYKKAFVCENCYLELS